MKENCLLHKLPLWAFLPVIATILSMFGLLWDISFHVSVGRDSAFTTPHLFLSALPISSFILFFYWIITDKPYDYGIRFFSLKSLAGGWVAFLGTIFFILSLIWDDWWHKSFGIDVSLDAPAHQLIAISLVINIYGNLMILTSLLNNVIPSLRTTVNIMLLFFVAAAVGVDALGKFELAVPNFTHDPAFAGHFAPSFASSLVVLPFVIPFSRWNSTLIAVIFTFLWYCFQWSIQAIEVYPNLGPIYNPINHMLPITLEFMIIPSAVAIDIVRPYLKNVNIYLAIIISFSFGFVIFIVVEWFYGSFMMSEYSHNWFFGGGQYYFYTDPNQQYLKEFWYPNGESPPSVLTYLMGWLSYYFIGIIVTFVFYYLCLFFKSVRR